MLDRMTSIEYAFALKQAKLEAAFQYAENRDDLDTMIEITKTMADLGIAEIEEMGRASDQQSKECRAIFSDRY